jgi:hypothetical protein
MDTNSQNNSSIIRVDWCSFVVEGMENATPAKEFPTTDFTDGTDKNQKGGVSDSPSVLSV